MYGTAHDDVMYRLSTLLAHFVDKPVVDLVYSLQVRFQAYLF